MVIHMNSPSQLCLATPLSLAIVHLSINEKFVLTFFLFDRVIMLRNPCHKGERKNRQPLDTPMIFSLLTSSCLIVIFRGERGIRCLVHTVIQNEICTRLNLSMMYLNHVQCNGIPLMSVVAKTFNQPGACSDR